MRRKVITVIAGILTAGAFAVAGLGAATGVIPKPPINDGVVISALAGGWNVNAIAATAGPDTTSWG